MGRTNIVLDDKLMSHALKLSGLKTKREVVNQAIVEFIARRNQHGLLKLYGKGLIDPAYDYKVTRAGK